MDYGKSGNPKTSGNTPRFSAAPAKGKPAADKDAAKAALLARMKAAAAARKPGA